MSSGGPLVVAYALTKYLQSSQTFVEGEITQLRRAGNTVVVVALERGHVDRSADPRSTYLDHSTGLLQTLLDHLACAGRSPLGYLRFLLLLRALRSELGWRPEQLPWWRLPHAARKLRRDGVQIVHAHFGWSGAAAAACLGALVGVPWSMTLHAKDIFVKRHNLEWKLRHADLIVTVADYNRRWIRDELNVDVDAAVLTCGITIPSSAPTPRSARSGVVTVGRLIPKKGVHALVAAVGVLHGRGRDVRLDVLGDGPERGALEAQANVLGVSHLVRFAGEVPHEEALDRIGSAAVFCLPCRLAPDGDRDAVPTVIVEAMARAVPVISTKSFGVPELVDDSCGRLVDSDDPELLADALTALLDDERLRERLGEAGARRAREHFSVEGQVARLADLMRITVAR